GRPNFFAARSAAFRDESGRLLLSKTAVAEIGKQLWEDYKIFRSRCFIKPLSWRNIDCNGGSASRPVRCA
ncbi:MAG: hypothetical protein OEU92_10080, partial [Alphaproteobacteria bacterium]|nr:hypothetical protein [Alphaproteobacteria bacterium]